MAKIQDKILRYRVIEHHIQLVRNGEYQAAWGLLYLLRNGKINLGLSDDSARIESVLQKLGCKIICSRNFTIATAYLQACENIIKELDRL